MKDSNENKIWDALEVMLDCIRASHHTMEQGTILSKGETWEYKFKKKK